MNAFSVARRTRALAVVLMALASIPCARVSAQSITLDAFSPAPTGRDGFATSSAESQGHLRFGAQIYLDYANDPLVFESQSGEPDSETASIVEHHLVGHLGLSLGLADRVVLFAGLPVSLVMNGDSTAGLGVPPADGTQLGDAHVGARLRLFGSRSSIFMMALQARVTFPTADLVDEDQAYAGDQSVTVHPEVIAQINAGRLRLIANLGMRIRENQRFLNAEIGDQMTYGLGALIEMREGLDAVVELHGASTVQQFFHRDETPLELLAGVKYRHTSGFTVGFGAGPGLVRGVGSPDVRALMTVGYTPPDAREPEVAADTDGDGILDDADACPNEPEDVDRFEDFDGCPDPDNDRDGVLDPSDECPADAEDADGFEDENGCPDPDNDADGVIDSADACPLIAEDRDQFEDENGCPDPDNDADGVLDAVDVCPLVVGVPEERGCPRPDRDGDSVLDAVDNCPDEPGTVENHGCRERQLVLIANEQLEIVDNVYFRTNSDVIEQRSFNLLDNVARVINAHPEIARVRVEGHSDARGNHDRNVRLSQARAASVVRYLTERGVVATRVQAIGLGPDRPIIPNARTREDHARNRRVEFHIEAAATPAR